MKFKSDIRRMPVTKQPYPASLRLALSLLGCMLLASCALVSDYRRPQTVTPPAYRENKDWKTARQRGARSMVGGFRRSAVKRASG